MKKNHFIASMFVAVLFVLSGCSAATLDTSSTTKSTDKTTSGVTTTSGTTDKIPVTLVRKVDGDTIKVMYKGEEKTVRYLLMDTPETKKPNSCVQPYGEEASERNDELLHSGSLSLEFDVGGRTDKYGRLLAYVYVDGKSIQETLIKEGYARVAYVYPPNTRHLTEYQSAEKVAKAKRLNIWKDSGYATNRGFNGCVTKTNTTSQTKTTTPKVTTTKQTSQNNVYYQNCTAVRNAGAAPIRKGDPGYSRKLDRDGDGVACE